MLCYIVYHTQRYILFIPVKEKDIISKINNRCFNYSFLKPNNLKEILNSWDYFIDNSINSGDSHFAITINIPKDHELKNYFTNVLRESQNISFESVEYNEFIEKYNLLYTNNVFLENYIYDLHVFIKTTKWMFFNSEENKNGVLHVHGLIAIKNLLDYNKNMSRNMSSFIKEKYTNCDILIKDLKNFKDIKG
jgi:hypothetical protein